MVCRLAGHDHAHREPIAWRKAPPTGRPVASQVEERVADMRMYGRMVPTAVAPLFDVAIDMCVVKHIETVRFAVKRSIASDQAGGPLGQSCSINECAAGDTACCHLVGTSLSKVLRPS